MLLCVLRVLVKRISIVVRVMESVQHRRTRELKCVCVCVNLTLANPSARVRCHSSPQGWQSH